MRRTAALVPMGFGLFFSLVFAGIFVLTFGHTWRVQSWPETECEILDARAFDPPNDESSSWDVAVSWRYELDGGQYQKNNASPEAFGMLYEQEDAEAIVARYAVGAKVPCYYNPADPIESHLDRSMPPWSAILFAIAVGVTLLATLVGIIVVLVRGRG